MTRSKWQMLTRPLLMKEQDSEWSYERLNRSDDHADLNSGMETNFVPLDPPSFGLVTRAVQECAP